MTTNILIGVGGTGAKVAEAVMHATAVGLGPKTLLVGFVDQDQSNGNVSRARQLLTTLAEARAAWRTTGRPHALGDQSGLLTARIAPIAQGHDRWIPHADETITLARIFERDRMTGSDKDLLDVMFASGKLEQEMALGEGYRGRPHLGAAAMASAIERDSEFWRALMQAIKQAQGGDEVRLVLTGSVFGGTGAAGFPTLARIIRRRLKQENIGRNVLIGGALMLPYFGYAPPENDDGAAGNVARTEQLLMQSREALRYYHTLFSQEAVFDQLYFVGWEPYFHFDYHKPGSEEQANPALVPELIAAMGVCKFMTQPRGDEPPRNQVFVSARKSASTIFWEDIPAPNAGLPNEPYERFGQALRFAAAWKFWGGMIGENRNRIALLPKDAWYRRQGLGDIDFKKDPPETEFRRLSEYLDQLLIWASAQQYYCKQANLTFKLWDTTSVVNRYNEDTPNVDFVVLRPGLSEAQYPSAFNGILVTKQVSDKLAGSERLTQRLNERAFDGNHKGAGRVVAALHAFSALTE